MNRLAEIIATRKQRVATAKAGRPLDDIERRAREARVHMSAHAFLNALTTGDDVKIIGEFKRRSPSKGAIKAEADPVLVASQYEKGGATAISVLTEPDYFDGSLDDLRVVRTSTALPILRKDFIVDEYQVYESAAASADALLLIVAALNDFELQRLRQLLRMSWGWMPWLKFTLAMKCGARSTAAQKLSGEQPQPATFEVSLGSLELAPQTRGILD
jgi:indole-3-glycerol phosphate synthase